MVIKINYKEDFKVLVGLPEIIGNAPCKVVLHSGGARWTAVYDGEQYVNCARVDDRHLLLFVQLHALREGELEAEIFVKAEDKTMPSKEYLFVSRQPVLAGREGEEAQILLVNGKPDRFESSEFMVDLISPILGGTLSAELAAELRRLRDLGITIDTTNDVLRIGGKAYKLTPHREVVRTDVTYANPVVTLAYATDIPVAGGTANPTLTVTQKKTTTTTYSDGTSSSQESNADVSAKTVTYTKVSGDGTLNTSTGVVTYNTANSVTSRQSRAVVKATVAVNGMTGESAAATVYQKAKVDVVYAEAGVQDTVPTSLASMTHSSTGQLTISGKSGKVQYVAIPSSMSITSWYDNDEGVEIKNDITAGETFTYSGKSYTIYYNKVRIAEAKNFTIKFS